MHRSWLIYGFPEEFRNHSVTFALDMNRSWVYSSVMNQSEKVWDEELLLLLRYVLRVGKLSEAKLDGLLSQVDLSSTRLLTLHQLEEADEPLSLSQLASCLAFVKSNSTQLVDHLEADELVRRQRAPNDRRCT